MDAYNASKHDWGLREAEVSWKSGGTVQFRGMEEGKLKLKPDKQNIIEVNFTVRPRATRRSLSSTCADRHRYHPNEVEASSVVIIGLACAQH